MARIRTLKPSIWTDKRFVSLSRDARLLFVGLISMCDDEGRFPATVAAIAGYVFPYDDMTPAKVKSLLKEVVALGLATVYEVDGRPYGCLPTWRKHQRISKPQPSPLPAPTEGTIPHLSAEPFHT